MAMQLGYKISDEQRKTLGKQVQKRSFYDVAKQQVGRAVKDYPNDGTPWEFNSLGLMEMMSLKASLRSRWTSLWRPAMRARSVSAMTVRSELLLGVASSSLPSILSRVSLVSRLNLSLPLSAPPASALMSMASRSPPLSRRRRNRTRCLSSIAAGGRTERMSPIKAQDYERSTAKNKEPTREILLRLEKCPV